MTSQASMWKSGKGAGGKFFAWNRCFRRELGCTRCRPDWPRPCQSARRKTAHSPSSGCRTGLNFNTMSGKQPPTLPPRLYQSTLCRTAGRSANVAASVPEARVGPLGFQHPIAARDCLTESFASKTRSDAAASCSIGRLPEASSARLVGCEALTMRWRRATRWC